MNYVESGYVETGYIEGDGLIAPDMTNAKLKFFISKGALPEADEIEQVKKSLGENEIGIFYMPALKKFLMVNSNSFVEFVTNALDITTIKKELQNSIAYLNSSKFIASLANKVANSLNVNIKMIAPDGTVIASPVVTHNGTKFTFDVPIELSGIEYSVVIDVEANVK